jgi:hypothetical protein
LEARVQDRGGIAVQETLADRAARLQRAQDLNEAREAFQHSHEGVEAAREAHRRLVGDLKTNTELLGRIGCRVQDVYGGITMLVGKAVVLDHLAEGSQCHALERELAEIGALPSRPARPPSRRATVTRCVVSARRFMSASV